MDTKILQISSGRGPAECCLAVALTLKELIREAVKEKIDYEVIQRNPGPENGTLASATLKLTGKDLDAFCTGWTGVLQWIAQSPYRKFHKRKNWFISIESYEMANLTSWNEKDVKYETLRASGPGGQNVNKVETAVRAVHIPSGLQVMANDTRSQLQNKNLATERLRQQYADWQLRELRGAEQQHWEQHNALERGNPVRIYTGKAFKKT